MGKINTLTVDIHFKSENCEKVAKEWITLVEMEAKKLKLKKIWESKITIRSKAIDDEVAAHNDLTKIEEEIRFATIKYNEILQNSILVKMED